MTNPVSRLANAGVLVMLLATSVCQALDPSRRITQAGHTAWRVRDGAFNGAPSAIAQTKDGYIWVGTGAGLLRFDGVRFVPWAAPRGGKLPSTSITALLGAPDGSLWIGTQAGLARWTDGSLTTFPSERGSVMHIYADASGALWFSQALVKESTGPLCRIAGTTPHCYSTSKSSAPRRVATDIVEDDEGALWVVSEASVVRWKSAVLEEFAPREVGEHVAAIKALARTSDGRLWVGMASAPDLGLQQLVNGTFKPYRTAQFDGRTVSVQSLYVDAAQSLWVGTLDEGIYRISAGVVDHFRRQDGLSGDPVMQFLEDREGTLWVATPAGIDSFRDLPITTFTAPADLPMNEVDSVHGASDGTLWVGGNGALAALRDGRMRSIRRADGLPGDQITSMLQDRSGALWIGVENGLVLYRDGRFIPMLTREGHSTGLIVGLAEDVDGSIWAEASGFPRKLLHIRDRQIIEEYPAPQMPEARRLAGDPGGGIWLGLIDGNIARFRHGKLETFQFRDPGNSSFETAIKQIEVDADGGVLAASSLGIVGWKAGTKRTLGAKEGLPCDDIHGFVRDFVDDLWLYTQCGLVQIPKDQVRAWWRSAGTRVKPRVLDASDGAHPALTAFVSAARSTDGRLWFANLTGLQMIDPARRARNDRPPPVRIEAVVADRKAYSPIDALRLPAHTRDIQIDYTGLSFAVPEKVRFRYRLEGHERQWQEPGSRRQALYNDLPPAAYTFRVIASNNDGVWNETGARLRFSVAPAWYQTTAFRALVVVLAVFLLWSIYRIRMWQVAKALGARFDERLAERTRIARELHDTLLQTIQASKLVADSALASAADTSRTHENLASLSSWLGTAVAEGRAALNSLRASTTQRNDLADSLRALAQETASPSTEVVLSVSGEAREMHPIVRDEINRIGREAIRNALQHSGASRVHIELIYSNELRLRVSDNGKGIESRIIEHGATGHFGIRGMRERAANISGTLTITTSESTGTIVELIVPAHVVYTLPVA